MIERIKAIEKRIYDMFHRKELTGTIHLGEGQEAIDYGIISAYEALTGYYPFVVGNHRSHGQYLICGGNEEDLIKELKRYKGQHLYIKDRFITTGIQGGLTAFAVGYAMTLPDPKRVLCFIGDGTLAQGILYESFGLASLLRPNITYVIIDNDYSMSRTLMKPNMEDIASGFDLDYFEIPEGWDLQHVMNRAVKFFSTTKGPGIIYARCKRLCGHSCNDTQVYRPKEELTEEWKNRYESRAKSIF